MFNIFLLTNRQQQAFCYGQCFQYLGDPLNVIPEGDSNEALSYLAVLIGEQIILCAKIHEEGVT